MKLSEERNPNIYTILSYSENEVKINNITVTDSAIVTIDQVQTPWTERTFAELSAACLQPLIELDADVLIIGTGKTQRFPSIETRRKLIEMGLNPEFMENGAAFRTYNVLTTDERKIALAFVME